MKIYPVIHFLDSATATNEAAVARDCGADGVFLISHQGQNTALLQAARSIKRNLRAWGLNTFRIGINCLGMNPYEAACLAYKAGLNMLWADDMGVSSAGCSTTGWQLSVFADDHPNIQLFASVAFKYQAEEADPPKAARVARQYGFVPTTSGAGTGQAPALEKIEAMSHAAHGCLAIASGMTPENIAKFSPYLSHILVATGIGADEYHIEPERLVALIANSKQSEPA